MMQQRSATAQSFQEPNHSRFGVPWISQTMTDEGCHAAYRIARAADIALRPASMAFHGGPEWNGLPARKRKGR